MRGTRSAYCTKTKGATIKIATLDIETSALEAVGAGFLICAVVKPLDKAPKVLRYDDLRCKPAQEKRLIEALVSELAKYDLLVGHNIDRFDLNFIKSRALQFGIPFALNPLVYDTLRAFRRCGFLTRANGFGKPTASLSFVVDFLGIPQQKTGIYPREHWKAVWAEQDEKRLVLNHIISHCKADVEMTECVYRRLLSVDGKCFIRRMR